MPSQKNVDALQTITKKMDSSKNVILADYSGLSVSAQTDLRQKVIEAGGEFTVQKNNLLRIAIKKRLTDLPESMVEALNGPTAAVYSFEDAVSATKVLVEFAKENEQLTIKAGLLVGAEDNPDTALTSQEIKNLANLPSRDQLRAQVVGQLKAPINGFVNVLSGNLRGLVQVLKAVHDQKAAAN